jgi:hypothetical protein
LSDEEDEDEGAAAGAVAGVVEVAVDELSLLLELPLLVDLPELPLPWLEDFGLALPYPSAYHPPPLKETAGAERTRSSLPAQWGQTVISGSENFWIFSVWRWQAVHSYS